jgi:branched-chain amino acid transport system permease protein
VNLALSGLALGTIAAIAGIGLLVTYQTTGVFNVAHGAMAMLSAYLAYQTVDVWHWPVGVAAPLVVLVVAPTLGWLANAAVFRRLQRRMASPAESLVASLALLAVMLGAATLIWGNQTHRPSAVFPQTTVHVAGAFFHLDTTIDLGIALCFAGGWWALTRTSRLGTQIRAVVSQRQLAELAGVDADRVSSLGWAIGAALAGLAGVLIAPVRLLNPYTLTLVVLEIFAVPVIARLASIGIGVLAGLGIGVLSAELTQFTVTGSAAGFLDTARSDLYVVALLLALLLLPRLREVGPQDAGAASSLAQSTRVTGRLPLVGLPLLLVPLAFGDPQLRQAQLVPALAIIFLSLVAIAGYSGQVSLGQAGYAGLGGLFFARFSTHTPELLALLFGMIAAAVVGLLTGYPAIRRRGLFLALTTYAVGAFVDRFVFNQTYFAGGILVSRPNLFGLHLGGDRSFYSFEVGCLVVVLLLTRNLRSGRLGRMLAAMRDNEDGARAVGLNLRRLKVFIFTISAAVAGLGGALLVQSAGAFDPSRFEPLEGLLWFLVVVAFGVDSATWAVVAAAVVVAVNALIHNPDAYSLPIGILALALAGTPGGLAGLARVAPTVKAPRPVRLTPLGVALAARIHR